MTIHYVVFKPLAFVDLPDPKGHEGVAILGCSLVILSYCLISIRERPTPEAEIQFPQGPNQATGDAARHPRHDVPLLDPSQPDQRSLAARLA